VNAGVGTLDGLAVCVGGGAPLVGKKAKVRIERVLNGTAYATLVGGPKQPESPITAEDEAEKPTRKPPARKKAPEAEKAVEAAEPTEPAEAKEAEPAAEDTAEAEKPKKKTRRGSRGGRRRRKKPAAAATTAASDGEGPKIHLPDPELGRAEEPEQAPEPEVAASEDGAEPPKPKKKTRRGSRGGRRRRKSGAKTASTPSE